MAELEEPFKTMAQIAVCFGLRVSELLALQWRDVDWLNRKLNIERVMQNIFEAKMVASQANVHCKGTSGYPGTMAPTDPFRRRRGLDFHQASLDASNGEPR